jgi:hypothetical protein
MSKMLKVRGWTFDVWGNEEDGYEINDRYDQGTYDVPEKDWLTVKPNRMLKWIKEIIGLKRHVRANQLEIDSSNEYHIFVEDRKGYPLGELEVEAGEID